MSVSTISVIKERIRSATERSKIAVFIIKRGGTHDFNAIFDNTIATKKRIAEGCDNYIGSYHGSAGAEDVTMDINKKLRN